MIGIATTFFWIFLIAFFASAAYSVKDFHFDIGEPFLTLTSDNKLLFCLPVDIENKGYYNIGLFNITTETMDRNNSIIAKGSTFIPVIKAGAEITAFHNLTLDIENLLEVASYYLFNDTELSVSVLVDMKIAEIIPVQASTNFTFPWGAPFYNFRTEEPIFEMWNYTHFRVKVPISFENHASFNVSGKILLKMYNDADSLVGCGETVIEVEQQSAYSGFITLYVSASEVTPKGFLEVYFSTPPFDYGPLVIPYG